MKIRQKIVIAFLLIGVIPALFFGLINLYNIKSSLEESGKNTIKSVAGFEVIARLKAERLEAMIDSIKEYVGELKDSVVIKDNLPTIAGSFNDTTDMEYVRAKGAIDNRFSGWMDTQKWVSDIVLVDTSGKIIYAFDKEHFGEGIGGPLPDMEVFEKGKVGASVGDVFMHKHKDTAKDHPGMLVVAPIKDDKGVFLGEIVLAVKMSPIYDFIQDGTGLGETGEVLLGKKVGDEVLILNPLRFDKDAALKRKLSIGSSRGVPIQKAVSGEIGSGTSIDYRGEEVVGAWRTLPSLGWGIVAKMDKKEVFSELDDFRNLTILILIILVFISVVVALYFARSISDPISRLTLTVNEISRGKLDVKIDKLDTKDEVGDLARAFERVVVSLKLAMRGQTQDRKDAE